MPALQGQRPSLLVDLPGPLAQLPGAGLIQTQHRVVIAPQRHLGGAGQGGGIEDVVGTRLGGAEQTIGQHQTPLGIGIEDLDAGTVAIGQHVAQLEGMPAHQVLGAAEEQLDPRLEPLADRQRQGPTDHGGPAHVRLHRQHVIRPLDAVASRVEGDPLAHQAGRHRGLRIATGVVIEHQQGGYPLAAAANLIGTDMA